MCSKTYIKIFNNLILEHTHYKILERYIQNQKNITKKSMTKNETNFIQKNYIKYFKKPKNENNDFFKK